MTELKRGQVRKIRKLLKEGVDVPEICRQFNIKPEEWRELVNRYELF
ncbi:MAG: hypothetical protein QW597_05055 [Thermoplasmataceae archaeon]